MPTWVFNPDRKRNFNPTGPSNPAIRIPLCPGTNREKSSNAKKPRTNRIESGNFPGPPETNEPLPTWSWPPEIESTPGRRRQRGCPGAFGVKTCKAEDAVTLASRRRSSGSSGGTVEKAWFDRCRRLLSSSAVTLFDKVLGSRFRRMQRTAVNPLLLPVERKSEGDANLPTLDCCRTHDHLQKKGF